MIGASGASAWRGGARAVAALTACGKVATDDSVEEQIKSQLGTDSSDCPTDLQGEQGSRSSARRPRWRAFDVKVTVTSVSGDTINFSIERVGATRHGHDGRAAGHRVRADRRREVRRAERPHPARGRRQAGRRGQLPTCPRRRGVERCTLKAGADSYGVTVTVTGVQGTDVKFDIQVDQTPTTVAVA
jgi:hypothetical protein